MTYSGPSHGNLANSGSMDKGFLSATSLSKSFDGAPAVNDVSFSIGRQEVFGLLGPNGAGKTTTIRMLSTVLAPDAGDVVIGTHSVLREADEVRKLIGVCPQELALYEELSATDNLVFFGRMAGLGAKQAKDAAAENLEVVGLLNRASDAVQKFSGGMKRRVNLRPIGGQQQGGSGDVQGLVDVPGGVGQPTARRFPGARLSGSAAQRSTASISDGKATGSEALGSRIPSLSGLSVILASPSRRLLPCGRPSHSVCYRGRHPGGLPRRQPFALQVCGQGLEGGRIQRREGRTCSSGVFAYAYVLDRDRGIGLAYYHAAQDFGGREPWRVLVSPNVDGP